MTPTQTDTPEAATPQSEAQTTQPEPPAPRRKSVLQKLVPIERIVEDQAMQVRGGITPDRIKKYEALIKEFGVMDPIDVFFELLPPPAESITAETKFLLADGFHRLAAYRACGVAKIPCNIRPGTASEAKRFSLQRNGHHGEAPTNAEKRSMAEHAVVDPEIGALTDREIAVMIGCSASLVASARRGETKAQATGKKKTTVKKHERNLPEPKAASGKSVKEHSTKAAMLKEIDRLVTDEKIDESEILELFATKDCQYSWVRKPGHIVTLKIVGKSGREQVSVKCIVREIGLADIVLKSEDQKLGVVE